MLYVEIDVILCIDCVASDVYHLVQKFLLVFKYSEDAVVCIALLSFVQLCMLWFSST